MTLRIFLLGLCGSLLLVTGEAGLAGDRKPIEVPVAHPVSREVTDFLDYTGRTEASVRVELRARVSGILTRQLFKDGQEVHTGDLLFEIDPRPYQAELDKARAELVLNEARLKRLTADRERLQQAAGAKVVSPGELDKAVAKVEEAQAAVRAAQAGVTLAQLNLSFTRVTAPCGGVISRSLLSPGNVVKADATLLTQIVSLDPMYVYFQMDEASLLRVRRGMNDGKLKGLAGGDVPVLLQLQDEKGYPHQGLVNFINNQVNPANGTVEVRCTFANPRPAAGVRLMLPGMFARVRVPLGNPHTALLVREQAVIAEDGQRYVFLVKDNKLERRRVALGARQENDLREIVQGIQENEQIVTVAHRNYREGLAVTPKLISMIPKKQP
jgi:multidrug efflux system membrane fusion protein